MMRSRSITWVTEGCSDTSIRLCRDYVKTLTTPFLAWSSPDIYDTRRWMCTLTRYVNQRDITKLVPSDSVHEIVTKSGEYTHSDVVKELLSRGYEYEGKGDPNYAHVVRRLVQPGEETRKQSCDTVASLRVKNAQLQEENDGLRERMKSKDVLIAMLRG